MRTRLLAAAAAGALALAACAATPRAGTRSFALEELRADLRQLETTAMQRHPFPYGNRAETAAAFAAASAALRGGMTAPEFLRVLSPAVASIRCGHTFLSLPGNLEAAEASIGKVLPLAVWACAEGLFVLRDLSGSGIPDGSRIRAIDGRPGPQVIGILLDSTGADGWNLTGKYWRINRGFQTLYARLLGAPDSFRVEYEARPGYPPTAAAVPAVPAARLRAAARPAGGEQAATRPYSASVQDGCAVMRIASFNFYDAERRQAFCDWIDDFFVSMEARGGRSLILDLRGNSGGDPYNAAALLDRILPVPTAYFAADVRGYGDLKAPRAPSCRFRGPLYVLIDGGCFSTTGHLCSLLRFHGIGTFLGEETGGSFQCTDGSKEFTLERSGLRLRLSTMVYAAAVEGLPPGRGILPDLEIRPTVEDLLAGRDPVLETAVRLAGQRRGTD